MAVMFTGHRLHYVCDDEADINPAWEVGSCIYVINSNRNYMMCSSGVCAAVAQIQSDWTEANAGALDFIKNKPSLATVATSGSYNDLSNKPSIPNTTRTSSALTLAIVGTGATGTQISSSKDSTVRCSVSTSTTSTIGGPGISIITLKICATNSSTESDWTEQGRVESDQTITLAVVLQSIQVVKGQICADIPAGWYVKLVGSGSGTHSESYVSGQKTIFG